jgi:hypothetical protein
MCGGSAAPALQLLLRWKRTSWCSRLNLLLLFHI